jgi:hypothetical protein
LPSVSGPSRHSRDFRRFDPTDRSSGSFEFLNRPVTKCSLTQISPAVRRNTGRHLMGHATALEGVFDAQADWDRAIRGDKHVLPELGRSPDGFGRGDRFDTSARAERCSTPKRSRATATPRSAAALSHGRQSYHHPDRTKAAHAGSAQQPLYQGFSTYRGGCLGSRHMFVPRSHIGDGRYSCSQTYGSRPAKVNHSLNGQDTGRMHSHSPCQAAGEK